MELATLSRGMAATTALVTTRKMKLIGIVLLVGVLGFCGWNEFDSSPSKEALVPVENEENIGPSKGLASSVFVMEELFPGERVEVSSDLSIEHVSPESALLREEIAGLKSELDLRTRENETLVLEVDRLEYLLNFYKLHQGPSLVKEFLETRPIAQRLLQQDLWQEFGMLERLIEDLDRSDFPDEVLEGYIKWNITRIENTRLLRNARWKATKGDENHPSNLEFDKQQEENAAEELRQLHLLGFNTDEIAKILD